MNNSDNLDEELIDDEIPELISLTQASELYGLHADYLGELARKGRLTARKVGATWVTTKKNIENYIKSRQKRGAYREIPLEKD